MLDLKRADLGRYYRDSGLVHWPNAALQSAGMSISVRSGPGPGGSEYLVGAQSCWLFRQQRVRHHRASFVRQRPFLTDEQTVDPVAETKRPADSAHNVDHWKWYPLAKGEGIPDLGGLARIVGYKKRGTTDRETIPEHGLAACEERTELHQERSIREQAMDHQKRRGNHTSYLVH